MIIQTVTDINNIQQKLTEQMAFVFPILTDRNAHPIVNTISSLHIMFESGEYVCVPYNHPDATPVSVELMGAKHLVALNKKELMHLFPTISHTIIEDLSSKIYIQKDTLPEMQVFYSPVIKRTMQMFQYNNINSSIPLSKWIEYGQNVLNYMREHYTDKKLDGFEFANDIIIPTLATIEKSGLNIDKNVLISHYGQEVNKYISDDMTYTEYNIYTSTGRPSNKYGGVNFAALHSTNGVRSAFTSRYGKDGILIQLDYEAFHLRLIADYIGHTLPQESVHTYLAQEYYGKMDISAEEYKESKQHTFSIMYGTYENAGNVEFFHKIKEHIRVMWTEYQSSGVLRTKTGKCISITDASPAKLFNYLIQWMETEEAMTRISTVCSLLEGHLTKPILYTYDALLLDLHRSEAALLPKIKHLMENNKFPVRIYKGENYNNLEQINI